MTLGSTVLATWCAVVAAHLLKQFAMREFEDNIPVPVAKTLGDVRLAAAAREGGRG